MEQALDQIQLPDTVLDALLSREGIYAPFLDLAEACERSADAPMVQSSELNIDADTVNRAHLAALAWAQSLEA